MKILTELRKITELLKEFDSQYALCGGIAASIYRKTPRFTGDIDIALIDSHQITANDLAHKIIDQIGLKAFHGFVVDPINPNKQLRALVCGQPTDGSTQIAIDFLLPVQPWVHDAVVFAQDNLVDLGFAKLPTITPEFLIYAKLTALESNPERYSDISDINEILLMDNLDISFLNSLIQNSGINFSAKNLALLTKYA